MIYFYYPVLMTTIPVHGKISTGRLPEGQTYRSCQHLTMSPLRNAARTTYMDFACRPDLLDTCICLRFFL